MRKILIVDDEKGVADMLRSYFEMQSFQAFVAYSGADALKQAKRRILCFLTLICRIWMA